MTFEKMNLAVLERELGTDHPAYLAQKELRDENGESTPEDSTDSIEDSSQGEEGDDASNENSDETEVSKEEENQEGENDGEPSDDDKESNEESESSDKDGELSEEGKPEDSSDASKQDSDSQKTSAQDKKPTELTDEDVLDFAVRRGLSIEKAKEELGHRQNIITKYDGDINKIAMANLDHMRKITAQAEEVKQLKTQLDQVMALQRGEIVVGDYRITKEQLINKYRESYPIRTQNMEDDEVFEYAKDTLSTSNLEAYQERQKLAVQKQETDAAKKKEELITGLPDKYKEFVPIFREQLDQIPAINVLSNDFNLMDLIYWARGGSHFDKAVKDAYEKGKASVQIKSVTPKINSKGTQGGGKSSRVSLTKSQKAEMEILYPELNPQKADHIKIYLETIEVRDRNKKKKG